VISETRLQQSLRYAEVEGDLCLFKHQISVVQGADSGTSLPFTGSCRQGVAKKQAIEDFLSGKSSVIKSPDTPELTYVSPEVLEIAAKNGFREVLQSTQPGHMQSIFDRYKAGEFDLNCLVAPNYSAELLFDRKREILPTAIYFGYLNGNFNNGAYKLKKALATLNSDSRIAPVPGKDLAISEIPYYNAERNYDKQIEFVFQPTREDMRVIWDYCTKTFKEYPSTHLHEAIFDLDLLNLRKSGATLHEKYYQKTRDF
jgi:hypothetical protein